jgi:formamidopyrimidine-DNA glycosylase
MPEGPECRRVYEGLKQETQFKTLVEVKILGGRFLKKQPVGLANLKLPSQVVGGGVHGKFIWLEFEENQTAWITLGMSGRWSKIQLPHSHLALTFTDGTELYFVDQRRFGTIKFADKIDLDKKLQSLGIDPLNDRTLSMFNMLRQFEKVPNKTVAEALMNQSLFAGIGNYIKCEVLYRSRISPHRLVSSLSGQDIAHLWNWTKLIIDSSYAQGGASIRNYRQLDESHGDFIFEFEVYSKKEDPFGNEVVKETTKDGRTTHWVPQLQV